MLVYSHIFTIFLSKINMDPDEQGFLMQKYAPLAKRVKEDNEQALIEATPEAA